MTSSLAVNSKNDIFINQQRKLATVYDQDAMVVICATAAKAQLGEMIFQSDDGVPNFQTIWRSSINVAQFQAALRDVLLNVDGVKTVISLTVNVQNSVLSYTANIDTIYGTVTLNG